MAARIGDLAQSQRLHGEPAGDPGPAARRRRWRRPPARPRPATTRSPTRPAQLVRAKDARELKATFVDQNERLTGRLQVMDAALASIVDIADRARTMLVQRLDGNLGDAVPLDARGRRDAGGDRGGAEHAARRPIPVRRQPDRRGAGGAAGDADHHRRPDASTIGATTSSLSARADPGLEIGYGVTADEPAFAELIAALGQARAAHLADDRRRPRRRPWPRSAALDRLTDLRAGLGDAGRAAGGDHRGPSLGDPLSRRDRLGHRGCRPRDVLTRIASDQASLEAAYTVTGRLAASARRLSALSGGGKLAAC